MGSFDIIVLHKRLGGGLRLRQVTRLIHGQAFFLIAAVVPFDEAILLWVLRGTHLDLNAHVASVRATACRAVSAVKSARTCASSSTEVPVSMMLSVSTTCCRLPLGSAGTLETSLKSSCQHVMGAGRSMG